VASAGLGCGLVGRRQGKEHALIISNHWSDVDWLIGWILAQRSGCLGSKLAVMKSSRLIPELKTLQVQIKQKHYC